MYLIGARKFSLNYNLVKLKFETLRFTKLINKTNSLNDINIYQIYVSYRFASLPKRHLMKLQF